jgi:hypothetical protein
VERARQFTAEHFQNFVAFHGSDFAVFADGLAAAAAKQRHLREQIEVKMGLETPAYLAKQGLDRHGPKFSWPEKLVGCQRGVAVCYHEGEGVEIMADFDLLRSGLTRSRDTLTDDEAATLQAMVESAEISPAFVRRVIREYGSAELAALYYLPTGDDAALDYLLRQFKGSYYRRRYPNQSLLGVAYALRSACRPLTKTGRTSHSPRNKTSDGNVSHRRPMPSMGATVNELTVIGLKVQPGEAREKRSETRRTGERQVGVRFRITLRRQRARRPRRPGRCLPSGAPFLQLETADESLRHLAAEGARLPPRPPPPSRPPPGLDAPRDQAGAGGRTRPRDSHRHRGHRSRRARLG